MYAYIAKLTCLIGFAASLVGVSTATDTQLPLCFYVSSYHQGYAWSDGVEHGLRSTLEGHCEIQQFDMDTKRLKSKAEKEAAGEKAFNLIVQQKPDVVITSDDNAAKFLIMPYLKDVATPVIFSGINWTVEEYGFPYDNVTGIVEVAPIAPMLKQGQKLSNSGKTALYLGAKTLTEEKNYTRINKSATRRGITLEARYAESFDCWTTGFKEAQTFDFIIMGSNSGITDWNEVAARNVARTHSVRPSLTNHEWMMPYTLIGYTKIAEEHGEWAGLSAIAVLNDTQVSDIPLATNKKWDSWINTELIEASGVEPDRSLMMKAKKIK